MTRIASALAYAVLAALLLLVLTPAPAAAGFWQSFYQGMDGAPPCGPAHPLDRAIERAVRKHWYPPMRYYWCAWKQQLRAESNLHEDAVSPVGARGIAQIMPATWLELADRTGIKCHWRDAKCALELGAIYMRWQMDGWHKRRSPSCLLQLAQASYNAGRGNIYKAQKVAGGATCWGDGISESLTRVTGRHADETRGYVARIGRFLDKATKGELWGSH